VQAHLNLKPRKW